jgi:hypothetical protein|nr:MAG TPA: hypothetical protein [Caudoviricetes sp.]
MSDKIGVINEIGDMGLGFDQLSERDQKIYMEQQAEKAQKKNTVEFGTEQKK